MKKTLLSLMWLNSMLALLGIMWSYDTYIWMGNITASSFLLMIWVDQKNNENKFDGIEKDS
jgi:hypothetical protein